MWRYALTPKRDLSGDGEHWGLRGSTLAIYRLRRRKKEAAICDDGYTFTFYFYNQPASKKYLNAGFSSLHAHIMALFDCFMDK
jgi:hypothetical protein